MEVKASTELKLEIKNLLIDTLVLEDLKPADITDDGLLFDPTEGLGIDSVDALELVNALQKKYGVRIGDQNQGRFIIKSIDTIADFIATQQAGGNAQG
jgi:acyl carrier protein